MIGYIVLTYLLSIVGWAFYWLFMRNRIKPFYAKTTLISIVVLCFAIPFAVDSVYSTTTNVQPCLHSHDIPDMVIRQYCPVEDDLNMCYELAQKEEQFCECEEVSKTDLLYYKSNPLYDWLLAKEAYFINFLLIMIAGVLLILFSKIAYLVYLIISSKKRLTQIGGHAVTILYPKRKLSVSSFRFWHPYIIWQDEIAELSESEQQAVMWHEMSHLYQKDTWLKIAFHLMQTIWLLNPIYYFMVSELDRINEHIADDFAVTKMGSIKKYASLLVKMKRYENLALAHSFKNNDLKKRVQYLLQTHPPTTYIKALPFVLLVSVFLSGVTFCSMTTISETLDDFKFYEQLSEQHRDTGKTVFCKNCMINN